MLDSVLPIFLVILLGVAIRRYGWMPADFFASIEKFSYNVAFPALLFTGTAKLSFAAAEVGELALATLLPTFLVVGLSLLLARWSGDLPGASRSSVVQGASRPNSYFGIAVSALLFEPKTASLVMLSLALCLPVVNVVAIVALTWWGGGKSSPRAIAKTLASNPIILSTLAGVACSLSGLAPPAPLMTTGEMLGKAALALGLLSIGGGLIFSTDGLRPLTLTATSALKLVLMPLAAAKVSLLFGVSAPVALAAGFYCALPTAPNAYIMAKQMGGDARLMASLITLQTLLAAFTVPASKHLLPWLEAAG